MTSKNKTDETCYISKRIKDIVHIHCPLFEQSFWVFLNCKTSIDFKRAAERVLPNGATVDVKMGLAGKFTVFDFSTHGTIGLIWAKDKLHLVHECLHAANWSLDDRGVPIKLENDEISAYYQTFLLREIKKHGGF